MSVCGGAPTDRESLVGGCVRLEVAGDSHPDIIYTTRPATYKNIYCFDVRPRLHGSGQLLEYLLNGHWYR